MNPSNLWNEFDNDEYNCESLSQWVSLYDSHIIDPYTMLRMMKENYHSNIRICYMGSSHIMRLYHYFFKKFPITMLGKYEKEEPIRYNCELDQLDYYSLLEL